MKKSEDGNFDFFVNWKSKFDRVLKAHLVHAACNAKYTSPRIQNEVIKLCDGVIREKIVNCIPKYWSVMADETQDESTDVQVSISIRYVNSVYELCEEFIGFITVQKTDAQTISDAFSINIIALGIRHVLPCWSGI
jgi:hypothetical protein